MKSRPPGRELTFDELAASCSLTPDELAALLTLTIEDTIGYLSAGSLVLVEATAAFTDALRELGWIEGKNVAFERRYAENRLERLAEFAAELVHLNVDVIVAEGTLAPLAAKRATSTIPIVMTVAGDPMGG